MLGEWLRFTGHAGEPVLVNTLSGMTAKPIREKAGLCRLSFPHGVYYDVRADIEEIALTVAAVTIPEPVP